MKELTAQNVSDIFKDCLFQHGEDTSNAVMVECVMINIGFHPDRLLSHKTEIREMLEDLPIEFQSTKHGGGDGWSFLNACVTKNGNQWGEHNHIDQLLGLGIATKQALILIPREMWKMFPGGLPYFKVTEKED